MLCCYIDEVLHPNSLRCAYRAVKGLFTLLSKSDTLDIQLQTLYLPAQVSLQTLYLPAQVSLQTLYLPAQVSLQSLYLPAQVSLQSLYLPAQVSLQALYLPAQVKLQAFYLQSFFHIIEIPNFFLFVLYTKHTEAPGFYG